MANPSLVVPIADQVVTKGQSVSLSFITNIVDPDAGESLVYSVSGLPTGTAFSLDVDTGELTATPNAADIAALPFTVTITARARSNSNVVGSFALPIESGAITPDPGVATFYITNTGVTGAGTELSPFSVAQWNNFNIASLSPTPTGHVDGLWAPANYDNQPYIPRYGGLSASVRVRNRVASAGVVRYRGPQTGSGIQYGVELRSGTYSGVVYAANFVEFMRETGKNFEIDGQVVFGTGGGEVGKGESPENVAKIHKGILLEAGGYVVDLDITRTAGWAGVDVAPLAYGTYRINYTQHGTPFYPPNQDFGDSVWIAQSNSSALRHLFDAS